MKKASFPSPAAGQGQSLPGEEGGEGAPGHCSLERLPVKRKRKHRKQLAALPVKGGLLSEGLVPWHCAHRCLLPAAVSACSGAGPTEGEGLGSGFEK